MVFCDLVEKNVGLYVSALVASLAVITVTFAASILWKKYIDDASVIASRTFAVAVLK
jgi:hypothetical protein